MNGNRRALTLSVFLTYKCNVLPKALRRPPGGVVTILQFQGIAGPRNQWRQLGLLD